MIQLADGRPVYKFGQELVVMVPGHKIMKGRYLKSANYERDIFLFDVNEITDVILVDREYVHDIDYPFYPRKILTEKEEPKDPYTDPIRNDIIRRSISLIVDMQTSRVYGSSSAKLRVKPIKYPKLRALFKKLPRLINNIKNRLISR